MGNKKLSYEQKERLYREIVKILKEAATNREVLTYTELVEQLPKGYVKDVRDAILNELLHKVAVSSKREHGVLLSALVINVSRKRPGDGFYESARKLGFEISASSSNADKNKFWQEQRDACFMNWSE